MGSPHLYRHELGAVVLRQPRRRRQVVREVRIVWARTQEVEEDEDVEGEYGDRQVPAVQQRGETSVQKDTGDIKGGGGVMIFSRAFPEWRHRCNPFLSHCPHLDGLLRGGSQVYFIISISLQTCVKGQNNCELIDIRTSVFGSHGDRMDFLMILTGKPAHNVIILLHNVTFI